MPGFTDRERMLVAALCRYHRKALPNPVHTAFQSLAPEDKRVLTVLIPMLRLADNMVRGPERRIQSVACRAQNGEVILLVHSNGDIDLEQWGAERAAGVFQQVFGPRTLTLVCARDESSQAAQMWKGGPGIAGPTFRASTATSAGNARRRRSERAGAASGPWREPARGPAGGP